MITFNLDMTPTYKLEYEWGWINKEDLNSYAKMGILSKAGYKEILGVDYEEQN